LPADAGAAAEASLAPGAMRSIAGARAGSVTGVTTVRSGTSSAGEIVAATSIASRRDSPKNRGRTSSRFSGESTRASSNEVVRQSRPDRKAVSTGGNRWMSSTAVLR
jgi:hypothetical protein